LKGVGSEGHQIISAEHVAGSGWFVAVAAISHQPPCVCAFLLHLPEKNEVSAIVLSSSQNKLIFTFFQHIHMLLIPFSTVPILLYLSSSLFFQLWSSPSNFKTGV